MGDSKRIEWLYCLWYFGVRMYTSWTRYFNQL